MSIQQKTITQLVSIYRKLPLKPLNGILRGAYYKYLEANAKNRNILKNVQGINYELDLTEVIDSAIYYNQNREPNTLNALNHLCKPGDTVFDIGANVGSLTLPIAKAVGPQGTVYAFEPVPWALDKLRKNISLNNFDNIHVQAIALSDYIDKNVEFSLRASFKATSQKPVDSDGSLNDNWWQACEKVKVEVQTLDAFVVKNEIQAIDIIKLDVDGFEAKVLIGAKQTLTRFSPHIIMEFAPSWIKAKGDDINVVISFFETLGYSFFDEATFEEIPNISNVINQLKPEAGINVVMSKRKYLLKTENDDNRK